MFILDPTGTYLRPPTSVGSTDSPTKSSASNTSASATRRYGQQLASAYLDPTGQY